jgi:KaiC/GvpD/RAD55 family RecA-like ATPase
MQRIPSGIKGFDELIEGGFPKKSCVLISGSPGTGKTIMGLEFIYNGAKNYNEKGMFISFEQDPTDLKEQCKQLGFDIDKYEKEEKITFVCLAANLIDRETSTDIIQEIKDRKINRVVLDSLSALLINAPLYLTKNNPEIKRIINDDIMNKLMNLDDIKKNFIYKFVKELKATNTVSLLLTEVEEHSDNLSSDGISEFVCDGVIKIKFENLGGDYSRSLIIKKMRMTKNNEDVHPIQITNEGIIVHNLM